MPLTHEEYKASSGFASRVGHLAEEMPLVAFGWLLLMLLVGWPTYLVANVTDQPPARMTTERISQLIAPLDLKTTSTTGVPCSPQRMPGGYFVAMQDA